MKGKTNRSLYGEDGGVLELTDIRPKHGMHKSDPDTKVVFVCGEGKIASRQGARMFKKLLSERRMNMHYTVAHTDITSAGFGRTIASADFIVPMYNSENFMGKLEDKVEAAGNGSVRMVRGLSNTPSDWDDDRLYRKVLHSVKAREARYN